MAKEEKAAEGAEAPPKKSKKLLIIIVAAVVVLAIAGTAAVLLLKKGDHAEDEEVATEKDTKAKKKKGEKEAPPVFIPMEPFTVNLVPETGDQYLQVTLSLEAEDAGVGEKLKVYTPKLRNKIMLLLSSKKPSELAPKEGKETLALELRDEINGIIAADAKKGEGPVKEVLFTSFIIQ